MIQAIALLIGVVIGIGLKLGNTAIVCIGVLGWVFGLIWFCIEETKNRHNNG